MHRTVQQKSQSKGQHHAHGYTAEYVNQRVNHALFYKRVIDHLSIIGQPYENGTTHYVVLGETYVK